MPVIDLRAVAFDAPEWVLELAALDLSNLLTQILPPPWAKTATWAPTGGPIRALVGFGLNSGPVNAFAGNGQQQIVLQAGADGDLLPGWVTPEDQWGRSNLVAAEPVSLFAWRLSTETGISCKIKFERDLS